MGLDPVAIMFGDEPISIDIIEKSYRAIYRAKQKYPDWYKVAAEYIDKRLRVA